MSVVFKVKDIFDAEANKILNALRASFYEKDLVATGETVNSLRTEASQNGFKIWGGDWIEFAEYGRGRAKRDSGGAFLERLYKWARARGFPEAKVEFLKYRINKFGTLLHQGKDARFQGKQSKVLTSVLNNDLEAQLKETLTMAVLTNFKTYIRKSYD